MQNQKENTLKPTLNDPIIVESKIEDFESIFTPKGSKSLKALIDYGFSIITTGTTTFEVIITYKRKKFHIQNSNKMSLEPNYPYGVFTHKPAEFAELDYTDIWYITHIV